MISLLKSLFSSSPKKRLQKERDRKYKQAVDFQRNGKLREYANIMKEIEDIENQILKFSNGSTTNRSEVASHDIIDYDGMGNQGRFPSKK